MQIRLLCLAAAALVAGCATTEAPLRTERVEVPVRVACVESVPPRPELIADKVWAQSNSEWDRQRALRIDRARLLQHVERQEALLAGCAKK